MKQHKLIWQLPFLVLLIVGTVIILRKQPPFHTDQGFVFGTVYKVTYQHNDNLKNGIEKELKKVDLALSPFNPQSTITAINNNQEITPDSLFLEVFCKAQAISKHTQGAFDITVAPLVNTWGFGFKHSIEPTPATIDSIQQFVGYQKVHVDENHQIVKEDNRLMLTGSAIAKGYGVDRVAKYLDLQGVKNYMVEIGGEVVVKGKNPKMELWRIGINKPIEDSLSINQELETVLALSDVGMATSGNYRNFYYKGGKKYAHTIDPRSGYPVQHSILSATVLAKDCATADAYATAFMVMGKDKVEEFCENHPELEAYLICAGEGESYEIFHTPGMKKYIIKNKR